MTADEIIHLLALQKHPNEGGYFRETYRSPAAVAVAHLPPGYSTGPRQRSLGTAIYYLITPDSFSALHRLPGDEVFHHYLGDAVEMLMLHPSGRGEIVRIGKDLAAGESPQVVVPGRTWQGSRLIARRAADASGAGGTGTAIAAGFALLGCTMSPGFDYADYEHARRDALVAQFPDHADRIRALTPRDGG
jgi:predicted cupin superfamily sugar epimerase